MKTSFILPLTLALTLGCTDAKVATQAAESAHSSDVSAATIGAATHGMVLFGSDTLFVSHVPMFMSPHDWQAVIQVKLSHATSDALAVYQKAKATLGNQGLFTIKPKPFVLPSLLSGQIKSFQADLYKGNFEDGGRVILSNVTVTVDEILYKSQLKKTSEALEQLTYIPVDTAEASYLVHQITAPQNFDHIVQIQWLNEPAFNSVANNTTIVSPVKPTLRSFPLTDKESNRLQVGQYFTVSEDGTITEALTATEASFKVVADFYCTQGPDFYNLCD
ncbi:MAG: hypothetical protein H7318_09780 [Oligoflexus sp.]|nr:hypothetical protein [Oligoflexus sp.]